MTSSAFIQIQNPDLTIVNGTNNQLMVDPLKARESRQIQISLKWKDSDIARKELNTRKDGLGIDFKLNEFYQ
jgi:hypothetical protein